MDETLISFADDERGERTDSEPRAIGEVLAELLAQYQARFPEANIAVVDVSAAA